MSNVNARLAAHVGRNRKPDPEEESRVKARSIEEVSSGVTASWLAQVYDMRVEEVKKRLTNCRVLNPGRETSAGLRGRLYDLKDASSYLVTPKVSAKDFLKAVKRGELPPAMQDSFWNAMLKQQKWSENASQLYHVDDLRQALGQMMQTVKFTIQLWTDTIEQETGLTAEQRKLIVRLTDDLQNQMFLALKEAAANNRTGPQSDELGSILAANGAEPDTDIDLEAEALL